MAATGMEMRPQHRPWVHHPRVPWWFLLAKEPATQGVCTRVMREPQGGVWTPRNWGADICWDNRPKMVSAL